MALKGQRGKIEEEIETWPHKENTTQVSDD
jgi:hypothetical protein